MKILYLCADQGVDLSGVKGASIHVRSFGKALAGLGHEVTVVGTKVSSPESFQAATHVAVIHAPLAPWNKRLNRAIKAGSELLGYGPGRGRDLIRAFHNSEFFRVADDCARRLSPSFLYERYSLCATAGERLARKYSIPLVLEVNSPLTYEEQKYRDGSVFSSLARRAERRIWQRADLLVAVSEALRSHFEEAGVASKKIRILPNAVEPGLFRADQDGASVRGRLKLEGQFVIGFLGSFKAWHGVELLLRAFARLRAEDASSHLLLVGDGPMRPALEEEARRAGLEHAVTLVGSVPHEEVPSYLHAMDVAVAPYPPLKDFYYSPLKLYEYMAAGRAIVASRIGQVGEVLSDGITGMLCEPGDAQALIGCIRRLQHNEGLRNELGRNARMACAKNTWRQSAEQVIAWVEPLLRHETRDYATSPQHPACEGRMP